MARRKRRGPGRRRPVHRGPGRGGDRHRPEEEREHPERAGLDPGVQRQDDLGPGPQVLHRPGRCHAERGHRPARRPRQPADHHHPRHRPERLRHQQCRTERHLCGRGLSELPRLPDLPDLRSRADRGAEGTAGHPLRPQLQRRGRQLHLREAQRHLQGRPACGIQLVQHLQPRRRGRRADHGQAGLPRRPRRQRVRGLCEERPDGQDGEWGQ